MACTCDGGPGPEGQHQWYCGLDPDEIERCPASKSGLCLQMVEGFTPCDSECELASEVQQARGRKP